ncbi:MAG: septum formation initiator family protein [Caldilineaceae bacterium]|nr:septum formation initiator family protein [Caldilineaceae bacterium]MYA76573.1 septum formation initiator family protein [Gemmatimonadota bacterium]
MGLVRVPINPGPQDVRRQRHPAYPALLLLAVVVGLYFLFQHVEQLRELSAVQAQVAEMRQNIALGEQNTLDLEAQLRYATSDEYVVQMARGELGYIQEGDEVYILLDEPAARLGSPPAEPPAVVEEDSFRPLDWAWWQSLLQQIRE